MSLKVPNIYLFFHSTTTIFFLPSNNTLTVNSFSSFSPKKQHRSSQISTRLLRAEQKQESRPFVVKFYVYDKQIKILRFTRGWGISYFLSVIKNRQCSALKNVFSCLKICTSARTSYKSCIVLLNPMTFALKVEIR